MTAVAVVIVACLAILGAGVYYVARQVDIQPATGASAERQFANALSRFRGQRPLIIIEGDDWNLQQTPSPEAAERDVESLQVLVWEPDENKLARVRLPFWLLRLAGPGRIKLSPGHSDLELDHLRITVGDIERHGPGLILDHAERDGSRVLVWAE